MARIEPPVRESDAREEAPWFRNLPEHAKEEFRGRWRAEEERAERRIERRRSNEIRYVVEGILLFALLEFLFFGLGAGRLLLLTLPGAILGWVCHRIRADQWKYVGVAFPLYLAVYGALGVLAIGHFIVFLCVATALGFSHEMRRADGSEG